MLNKARACVVVLLLASTVAAPAPDRAVRNDVHTVHLLFSHHLDVGLNAGLEITEFCDGFATKIIQVMLLSLRAFPLTRHIITVAPISGYASPRIGSGAAVTHRTLQRESAPVCV